MLQQLQWVALCIALRKIMWLKISRSLWWLQFHCCQKQVIGKYSPFQSTSVVHGRECWVSSSSSEVSRKVAMKKNGLLLKRSGNCRFAYVFNFSEVWLYSFFKEQAALKSVWLLLIIFLCYSPIALNNRSSCPCFWSGQNESSSVSGSFRIVREGSGLRIIFSK